MAAFNFRDLSATLSLQQAILAVNLALKQLAGVLKGTRRESDGRQVLEHEIEIEGAGSGLILTTPDGTKRFRLAIDDSGAVTTAEL